jgi:hypothetical protein
LTAATAASDTVHTDANNTDRTLMSADHASSRLSLG